ncbi:MAG: hypothetical protein P1U36_05030 [Legionellaceae bacterium]|nr:hypothetical protein [Legionellaceae bacterium]
MYATSIFQSPPGEQFFVCDDHTSPLTQAYVRTNDKTTALTFSCSGALNSEVWACLVSQELPLFYRSSDTVSMMAAVERIDTIVAVLGALNNRGFISAGFTQTIIEHYPRPPAPTISLAAIEAEDSSQETDLCMDMSYFTDDDETPEPDAKRARFNS